LDPLSFSFLTLVILMGGVIALLADRLGRKLGKKRLSLLGLRPRRTAELLTVGAGVVIPLFTVLFILGASRDVRQWVTQGRAAIAQRDALRRDVEQLESQRGELQEDVRESEQTLAAAREELEGVRAELTASNRELQVVRDRLEEERRKVALANRQVQQATAQVKNLTAQVDQLRTQFATVTANLDQSRDALALSEQEFKTLQTSYSQLDEQRKEAFEESLRLSQENEQYEQQLRRLAADVQNLRDDRESLESNLQALHRDFDTTKTSLEFSKIELERTGVELARQQQTLRILGGLVDTSRTQPMIFRMGEELARIPVPPGLTAAAAENVVLSLLRQARSVAGDRGATSRGEGIPSAGLFERTDLQNRVLSSEDQQKIIVDGVARSNEDLVLVATSLMNAFAGEPVALDVRPYRNPLVYRAGQTIAEGPIDGNRTEDAILRQINEFLQTRVKERAKLDRMIPFQGTAETFGEISSEEILALVKMIRSADRTVRLVAFVTEDTRAGDVLQVKFKLR
jgi:predicted  nucleic acid-binding Zn-ribbon protein